MLAWLSMGGCAQIGMPTGGPKDTIPPALVTAVPKLLHTNFKGNRIVLTFNEYIVVDDAIKNVLVSPFPKLNPSVDFKLKTVTVKLKDTLLDNTTYSINFGNAIKDNNEGNPFQNFTYVFSTGNTIDSLTLKGAVVLAETGKKDSTLQALLYKDVDDTTVQHRRPDYVARINAEGFFEFVHLAPGNYKLYALKDNDAGKTYNSPTEMFAFADTIITVPDTVASTTLYAYTAEKDVKKVTPAPALKNADKKLKYTPSAGGGSTQSLLSGLDVIFNRRLKTMDAAKIFLTDTLYKKIEGTSISLDSTGKIISIQNKWTEGFNYRLLIDKEAVTDTLGEQLAKSDTIKFAAKNESDYGNLLLRFSKLDTAKHVLLQFVKGEEIFKSVKLTGSRWSDKLFEPGEYELRILYDDNNNGQWDPGDYSRKKQPEKAITLDSKLTIKPNWENERDIKF